MVGWLTEAKTGVLLTTYKAEEVTRKHVVQGKSVSGSVRTHSLLHPWKIGSQSFTVARRICGDGFFCTGSVHSMPAVTRPSPAPPRLSMY